VFLLFAVVVSLQKKGGVVNFLKKKDTMMLFPKNLRQGYKFSDENL
jgi:hypothetical protein